MSTPERNSKRYSETTKKLKSLLFTWDTVIFLFFLALSTAFWFVHSLDKLRETTLRIPIEYMGIPDDVALEDELPDRINIEVRDLGATLLKYKRRNTVPIALDVERVFFTKGRVVIGQDELRNRLSQYVFPTTAVLSVSPDSIVFNYNKLVSKTVPIELKGEVKIASQYLLSDKVQIEPSKVKVYGPKSIIDTLSVVYTEKFDQKAVSDTVETDLKLDRPLKGVKYEFDDVKVKVFTEMFTENKMEAGITIINRPHNVHVRLFPQTVTVTYNVGLSNFNKVRNEDIQVVFDYNEAKELNKRRYTLQLNNDSKIISNVRISPERVEFLLEEQ